MFQALTLILHKDKLKEGLRDETKDEEVAAAKHKKQSYTLDTPCACFNCGSCVAKYCVKITSMIVHIMMSEIMMLVNNYLTIILVHLY